MLSYSAKREIRGAYVVKNICKAFQKNKKTGPPGQRFKKFMDSLFFIFELIIRETDIFFFKAEVTNHYLVK
jgi:hypothetical protein